MFQFDPNFTEKESKVQLYEMSQKHSRRRNSDKIFITRITSIYNTYRCGLC